MNYCCICGKKVTECICPKDKMQEHKKDKMVRKPRKKKNV